MLLTIKDLSIAFGVTASPIVSQFNLAIDQGECVGLVGESGSGKSVTALSTMQLLPSTARVSHDSQVLYNGNDLLNMPEKKIRCIRGSEISMIFQEAMSALNPVYTIGNQLLEIIPPADKQSTQQSKQVAYDLLSEAGIKDVPYTFNAYPHQLSGGMRQRAMIAIALARKPRILIADEPTTALDVTTQARVLALLKHFQKKHRMALLFITHDLAVVSQLADRVVVMRLGKKIEEAETPVFFKQPQTQYGRQLLAAIPDKKVQQTEPKNGAHLLEVEHLSVYFPIKKGIFKRTTGHIQAVDDISFHLASGETLALVGESGSGKTTTGKAILKLLTPTQGNIILNGHSLLKIKQKNLQKLRSDMQIIFQDPYSALNPRVMIFNAIAEGLLAQKKINNKQEAIEKVNAVLKKVDLSPDMKWRYPHEFSGGQRQRICIARALVLEPKLLILDEPTSALDVPIQMQILQLLERLQMEFNLSYLFITHNLSIVAYIAHRVAVMYQGKIVEQGTTHSVLNTPQHSYTRKLISSIPYFTHQRTTASSSITSE